MTATENLALFVHATTLAWWPVTVLSAAVDGYHKAFFAVLDGRPL
ncbi:hypothetical protein [Azonexus sp.]|jgi:hypothetical protein|nr:hypothetical protein [Azonexus sp.]